MPIAEAPEAAEREAATPPGRRIIFNPRVLGGKPFVAGTRISVEFVLELLASGRCIGDIVAEHPQLSAGDVREAILFAAQNLKNDTFLSAELP